MIKTGLVCPGSESVQPSGQKGEEQHLAHVLFGHPEPKAVLPDSGKGDVTRDYRAGVGVSAWSWGLSK